MMPLKINFAGSSSATSSNSGTFAPVFGGGKASWLPLAIIGAVLLIGFIVWKGVR